MLKIVIPSIELYDESKNLFMNTKECELQLEHSLVSISKWESKWCKPFLSNKSQSKEEILDYIRCMTITQNVDPNIYSNIDQKSIDKITEYIDAPMTATTFNNKDQKATNKETITAEIIYYWMIAFQINWEAQRWHLNRLLTLINVCSIKNQPKKKRSRAEILAEQKALNAQRKAKLNTNG